MANPEEIRKRDHERPRGKRRYPTSRVQQALWLLIAVVIVAWIISLL